MGKTREAVRMKLARLEVRLLKVEKTMRTTSSSSTLVLPEELPSIEETLKTLAGALKALETPGFG